MKTRQPPGREAGTPMDKNASTSRGVLRVPRAPELVREFSKQVMSALIVVFLAASIVPAQGFAQSIPPTLGCLGRTRSISLTSLCRPSAQRFSIPARPAWLQPADRFPVWCWASYQQVYPPTVAAQKAQYVVANATHCDFEDPTDFLRTIACGGA